MAKAGDKHTRKPARRIAVGIGTASGVGTASAVGTAIKSATGAASVRDGRSPTKRRHEVQGYQASRVQIKLTQIFPDGIPSAKEVSDSELVDLVRKAFQRDSKKTGLAIPHPKTILRAAARIPRKK